MNKFTRKAANHPSHDQSRRLSRIKMDDCAKMNDSSKNGDVRTVPGKVDGQSWRSLILNGLFILDIDYICWFKVIKEWSITGQTKFNSASIKQNKLDSFMAIIEPQCIQAFSSLFYFRTLGTVVCIGHAYVWLLFSS